MVIPDSEHGLGPQEQAIMDAWDEGKSEQAIAAELGLSIGWVIRAIRLYSEGAPDRWHLAVRPATERLVAAIARAHPEMVAA